LNSKKRGNWLQSAIGVLIGLACALVLGAVFYGAMAYQLADGSAQDVPAASVGGEGALLALLDAQLVSEQTVRQEFGGEDCLVTMRAYETQDGLTVEAVCASPAAYIARLAQEGWTAQLVTGFSLAGIDAVYSVRGEEGMLSCRDGDRIYMLRAAADEQALYTLGAQAILE